MNNVNKYFLRFLFIALCSLTIFSATTFITSLIILFWEFDLPFEEFFRYALIFTGMMTIVATCISAARWHNNQPMPGFRMYTDEYGVHELMIP